MTTLTRRSDEELEDRDDAARRHIEMLTGTRFENELTRARAVRATIAYARGRGPAPVTLTPATGAEVGEHALKMERRAAEGDEERHRLALEIEEATWPGVVGQTITYILDPRAAAPI